MEEAVGTSSHRHVFLAFPQEKRNLKLASEVEAGLGEQGVAGQRGAHKAQGSFLSRCERISTP